LPCRISIEDRSILICIRVARLVRAKIKFFIIAWTGLSKEKSGKRDLFGKTDIELNNAIQEFDIRKSGSACSEVNTFITFIKFHQLSLSIYLPPLIAKRDSVLAIACC
jgi:hypothetical protein